MSILTTLGGTEDDDVALTKAFEGNRLDDLAKDVASAIKLNHLDGVNIYWVEPDLDGNVDRDAKGLVFLVKVRPCTHLRSSAVCLLINPVAC